MWPGFRNSTTHLTLVHVLLRCRENRNFHRLLAGLAIVDTVLIVILVLEMSVVGVFMKKEPLWYIISYPYIIHPGRGIVQVSLKYYFCPKSTKGLAISKGVFNFFLETNKNKSHSSKNESICLFFGRIHGLTICIRN